MKKKEIVLGIIIPSDLSKSMVSGGASGFLRNIIPYFKIKHTIIFGVGLDNTIPWKTYSLSSNVDFVPICNLPSFSKIPARLKVLIYYFRYRNRIITSGVEALYIHMPECCLPFLNNSNGIPIIYHKHGSSNPVSKSKYIYGRLFLFRKFYEIVLRIIYQNANWIITIDRSSLQESNENGGANKTSLLMNAVDLKKYFPNGVLRINARKKLGLISNIFVILFVGRLEKTKGPGRLLDCINMLKDSKFPFHIYFAGEGTYKSYLQKRVKAENYHENVTFLGHIKHEKMSYYYNVADVMVLPSETEGVPMVILEALACGTPVIASKVGSIPDIVSNGINGIVLDDFSPKELKSAIISILSKRISREIIAGSVKRFGAEEFVEFFDNIISNVFNQVH